MAHQFIGLQMLVVVRDPPARLKGTVSSVEAGIGLTLSNVWLLETKEWKPRVVIPSANIVDLREVVDEPPTAPGPVAPVSVPGPQPAAAIATPAFQDPAILSLGKRPEKSPAPAPELHAQPNSSEKRDPQSQSAASVVSQVTKSTEPAVTVATSAVVVESMARLAVGGQVPESADEERLASATQDAPGGGGRKKRRQRRTRHGQQDDSEAPSTSQPKIAGKGKGWRQTPILESTASFQPFNSLKKGARRAQPNENGWASEDVTDVQEMGDFDFEAQLAKFDKQNLFEQMRQEDAIDDADRLVSHNRLPRPKPGTAGGKNLHNLENVLDMPPTSAKTSKEKGLHEPSNDFWNSEADDSVLNGGERLSGRELGSRQGSRRGDSKVPKDRRSQSRKASATITGTGQAPSRINSGVSMYNRTQSLKGSRPSSRLSSSVVDTKKQSHPTVSTQSFYLLPAKRRVETVSALQMLNLENIAHNEIGLTEDMMTENAGRGIAEVTFTALADPAVKVRQAATVDASGAVPPPTVVVMAGNNKSGVRAVAAARHLRNKGINMLVCVVGLERGERELLEDMRQQVRLYKNLGGRIFSKIELFDHLRKISIPTLTIDTPRTSLSSLASPATVTLIIDALLGLAVSFEELRTGDQATVYELIEWANRNEAFVVAVDVPTGIDPSSGKVSVIDGSRLYVKPRYVVAMGAPKRGLLEAISTTNNNDDDMQTLLAGSTATLPDDAPAEWRLFLADMGLGAAVWKKAGTKIRRGIDFEDKWVLAMKYQCTASIDEPAQA